MDVQQSGEQFVTVENSMGVVHRSTGVDPASPDLRSEPSIVASLAEATLSSTDIDWAGLADDYDRIRDLMERSLDGFDDYNTRVRQSNGFSLPNPPGMSRPLTRRMEKPSLRCTICPTSRCLRTTTSS